MGRKSSIDLLPESLRNRLIALLAQPDVTQQQITDLINEEAGDTVVSRSAVNRYAQKMEEFSRKNRQAAEIAKVYIQQTESGNGNTLGKVAIEQLRLIIFELLMAIDEMPKQASNPENLLNLTFGVNKVAKALRDLESAYEVNIKIEDQIRAKTKVVADEIEKDVKQAGLSDEAAELIKLKILGISD